MMDCAPKASNYCAVMTHNDYTEALRVLWEEKI